MTVKIESFGYAESNLVSSSSLKKACIWICNPIKKWYSHVHKIMTWAKSLKSQSDQPLQVIMTHRMMYKKGALLCCLSDLNNTIDFLQPGSNLKFGLDHFENYVAKSNLIWIYFVAW